jgi:hypothetical protein
VKKILAALILSTSLLGGFARAQLSDVGNGLINHPAANMTWLSDGNPFLTQVTADPTLISQVIANWNGPLPFDHVLVPSDFDARDGAMTYWGALAWIDFLNATNYKGYNDWRMPDIGPSRTPGSCGGACYPSHGISIDSSEWFRLFYRELGGVQAVSIHTTHNANYGLFTRIGSGWSRNIGGDVANQFYQDGGQGRNSIALASGVWPVRTGLSVLNPPPMGRVVLSKLELIFPPQVTLTRSPPQTLTLTNRGLAPSPIGAMSTTSPIQADEFVVTHDCPDPLPAGASCTVSVTFRPQSLFTTRGTLTIIADGTPRTIPLTGSGDLGVYLDASATTVTAGTPVSLSWSTSTVDTTGCTAIGGTAGDGWAGALGITGARTVTATTAGAVTYELRCNFFTSFLSSDSVTVTYTLPAVTLTAASTNIQQGVANTLTWAATNATECTSTGNGVAGQWSGTRPTSGSATVIESTLGMITYTISCTAGTQSAQASVNVFVNAPPAPPNPPSSGGGGSFEVYTLLALCLTLSAAHYERRRRLACRR